MNMLEVISRLPQIIEAVEVVRGGNRGQVKKEDVRKVFLASVAGMELAKQIKVKNRRAFNQALDDTIDGIVGMLNASTWNAKKKNATAAR